MFKPQNANVDSNTGALVLTVGADAGGTLSAGEVFLDRSLGLGDYVFTVQTDPSLVSVHWPGFRWFWVVRGAAKAEQYAAAVAGASAAAQLSQLHIV